MPAFRVLLTGATGVLGGAIRVAAAAAAVAAAGPTDLVLLPTARVPPGPDWLPLDLLDEATVARAFTAASPDAVLHVAAAADPGWVQQHPEEAFRTNRDGTALLAELCRARGARLVAVSTDLVFPGRPDGAYREEDAPAPLSLYGQTKLEGEREALGRCPDALVVRTSLLLAPRSLGRGHVARLARDLEGPGATLFTDELRSPLLASDLARALLELVRGRARGLLHVAGPKPLSRHELGRLLAGGLGLHASRIRPGARSDAPPPPRPSDVTLDSRRAITILQPHLHPRSIESGYVELTA